MRKLPTQRDKWLIALAVLLVGFGLRVYRIHTHAYSGDEAFSVINWTRASLDYLLHTVALIDPQPPAVLLSFYGWVRLVGDTELATRMLSALASTITLATTYAIARHLTNPHTALIALILTAVNPFQIWYAQDFRSYSLWFCLSALSVLSMLRALEQPQHLRRWVIYIVVAAAGAYTFYLEGFFLIAQNLFVLLAEVRRRPHLLKRWAISQVAILLLLLPWFLRPSLRQSGYLPTAGPPNFPWAFETLLFGETLPAWLKPPLLTVASHTFTPIALVAMLLTACGLIVAAHRRRLLTFLALYSLLPIALLGTLAAITQRGYFRPRYVGAASIPLILTSAVLLSTIPSSKPLTRLPKALLGSVLATAIFTTWGTSLWTYYFVQQKAPLWREIAQMLAEQATSADVVIRNFPDPAFDYYYTAPAPAVLLPAYAGAPPAETERTLADLLEHRNYLWFLPVPSATFDHDQIVARWLYSHAQIISEQWIGNSHLLQFAAPEARPEQIAIPRPIMFAPVAQLRGYRITPPQGTWNTGTTLYLELFWEPLGQSEVPLTVFVHLLGPPRPDGSPLWAQDDHPPLHNLTTTQDWHSGKLLRDIYVLTLPTSLPEGEYAIAVGFYDAATGERLAIDPSIPQSEPQGATLLTFTRDDLGN